MCDVTDATSVAIARSSQGTVVTVPSAETDVDHQRRLMVENVPVAWLDPARFAGRHGIGNALAAAAILRAVGVDGRAIGSGLLSFPGLRHRLEELRPLDGVRFVNDSHSTAIASTAAALETVKGPIVLLLGGDAKRADLAVLAQHVRQADVYACVTSAQTAP